MTQVFDMKRLHMGCGESLRRPLPLPVAHMRRLPSSPQAVIDRKGAEATGKGNTERELSR
jgi:hypothetical protein